MPAAWKPESQAEGIRVAPAKAIRIPSARASGFKGTGRKPRTKSAPRPTTTTAGGSHWRGGLWPSCTASGTASARETEAYLERRSLTVVPPPGTAR